MAMAIPSEEEGSPSHLNIYDIFAPTLKPL